MAELQTIARPYAKAAFLSAKNSSEELAAWSKNLNALSELCKLAEVDSLIFAPELSLNDKFEVLKQAIQQVNAGDLDEKFQNLIRLLLENKKMTCVNAIASAFETMRADFENIIHAEITSALPISAEQEQAVITALSKRLGKQVDLSVHIDTSLIGGAIIQANDLVIDGSLRGQLSKLRTSLAN